jgi:DNA invertase Pin-like site-specific DNA recombinase
MQRQQTTAVRAAEYVRMSTESQTCSPIVQRQVIARYAAHHGIEIVRSYVDEGKSGLSLDGRAGLRSLLDDIQRGDSGFSLLLVFDVSRWGRFQDTDESAYYEFLCRKHGVQVVYCAEGFDNDKSAYSAVVKSLKRIMAAEFSRELSNKVYLSQRQWASRGFFVGGQPGYGRRRLLIDEHGVVKGPMGPGDRKGFRTDRTIIVPGPPEEVAVVREIFRLFLDEDLSYDAIAERLNKAGNVRTDGRRWRAPNVFKILSSDTYAGANVYARRSNKLHGPSRKNPRNVWVHVPGAFPPIVDPDLVARARTKRESWTRHLSDDDLLERLRALWAKHGRLSRELLEKDRETPSGCAYDHRFGSINRAYALIGYPVVSRSAAETAARTQPPRLAAIETLRASLGAGGMEVARGPSLVTTVNQRIKIGITIAAYDPGATPEAPDFWHVRFGRHPRLNIGVLGLLDRNDQAVERWFVIPRGAIDFTRLRYVMPDGEPVARFRVEEGTLWASTVALARNLLREKDRIRRPPTRPSREARP